MFMIVNVVGIVSPPLFRAFMECRTLLSYRRPRNGSEGSMSLFFMIRWDDPSRAASFASDAESDLNHFAIT